MSHTESVVQLVERCIHIAKVTGSSPVGFTKNIIMKKEQYQQYNDTFFNKWAPVYDALGVVLIPLRRKVAEIVSPHNKKVLDVACGTGSQSIALSRKGFEVVGLDLSEQMLELARKKQYDTIAFIQADATKIPYPNASFDASVISLALHDMPEQNAITVLKEMARVTKKGGQIIIADYNTPPNWLTNKIVSTWESRYYNNYLKVGINHFINNANLDLHSKNYVLLSSFQIIECIKK